MQNFRTRANAQFSARVAWGAGISSAPMNTDETAVENTARRTRRYRFDPERVRKTRRVEQRLLAVWRLIQSEYFRGLSCSELAHDAAMSRFHFIRTYTQAFGISPYQHLINVRIERASELLERTRLPIAEIATAIGFDTPAAFAETFRRVKGCSARQWREARQLALAS